MQQGSQERLQQPSQQQAQQRLRLQIEFIAEIDRLKSILRRNTLIDGSRRENTAEHSWHISMLAIVLSEYANEPVDVLHVVKMLLIHDVVEIDAGDTFCYDETAGMDKEEREQVAADRLFVLLPDDQAREFRALWDEFEAAETPEAKFANALDRVQPVLLNYRSGGGTWKQFNVTIEQIMKRNSPIARGSTVLWEHAEAMILDAMRDPAVQEEE